MQVWVKRVSTKDNIADLPSRQVTTVMQVCPSSNILYAQEYDILRAAGAREVSAVLADEFGSESAWDELAERWKL